VAVSVYRCSHCGREVLVRLVQPMTEAEIARRRDEEMRPGAPGVRARSSFSDRLRDDIWVGIAGTREIVPRDELPECCPACHRATLEVARVIED
jgi:ribosomal protein L37AE/L43A